MRDRKTLISEKQNERRIRKCSFYSSEEGLKELFIRLCDLGVFSVIDESKLNLRNYGVMVLEELGLLDEDKLMRGLAYMLSLPTDISTVERKRNETSAWMIGNREETNGDD